MQQVEVEEVRAVLVVMLLTPLLELVLAVLVRRLLLQDLVFY
jgi:hypothetical protein